MSQLDFPNNPQHNDAFYINGKTWKYLDSKWEIVKFEVPNYGLIDCGEASSVNLEVINGGSAKSVFTSPGINS